MQYIKHCITCDSAYRKVPDTIVRKLDFELQRCKVKISQNMVPRLILRFHIFLQYLLTKLLEGFDVKAVSSCKNVLLTCLYCYSVHRSTNLWERFSQNQLFINLLHCLQWNYHIFRLKNAMLDCNNFCTKIELKEQAFNSKKKIFLNFWPIWSLSMCWVHRIR